MNNNCCKLEIDTILDELTEVYCSKKRENDLLDNEPPTTPTMKKDEFDNVIVDKYVLEEIVKEYQQYSAQKDKLIGVIKENYKLMLNVVETMNLPTLEKYLCDNSTPDFKSGLIYENQFKCELCGYFICNSKKSLSAHQRGCKKYVGSL
jgi:hypothetical protein